MARIFLIAVTVVLLFLAGSAILGELLGWCRPLDRDAYLKCLYGFNLPGGTWISYSEHFPDVIREYGIASTINLGNRQVLLPVRVTDTLAVAVALTLLAALVLALFRQINRRSHEV